MKINFTLPLAVGFIGSIFTLMVFYTEYSMLSVNIPLAFAKFQKWPWFWLSTTFTSMSCTIPFLLHFVHDGEEQKMRLSNATYALGLLWIPLIFAYPGPKELGLLSDNVAGYAMFGICVTQYVTVKLVTKQILEAQQS